MPRQSQELVSEQEEHGERTRSTKDCKEKGARSAQIR